jgi:hypothetical protein
MFVFLTCDLGVALREFTTLAIAASGSALVLRMKMLSSDLMALFNDSVLLFDC